MDAQPEHQVLGGFFLALPFRPPSGQFSSRVPTSVVTASGCLTSIGPGPWALPWVQTTNDEVHSELAAFGLGLELLPEIQRWIDQEMAAGNWGWPNVFLSIDAVRSFVSTFHPANDGLLVLGLTLPSSEIASFLADNPEQPGIGHFGVTDAVRRSQAPPGGGSFLGYEILGEEIGGSFHSWLCNDLEPLAHDRLNVVVNAHGLIDDLASARAVAQLIASDDVGAEPVPWRPWRLATYPLI